MVILTSTSESPEQLTEALAAAGHASEIVTEGDAPEKQVGISEKKADAPAEKVVEEAKPQDKTVSDSEPDKEEKKTIEKVKAAEPESEDKGDKGEKKATDDKGEADDKSKPALGTKPDADDEAKPNNRADRKLLTRIDKVTAQKNQLKESLEERDARIAELEAKLAGKPTEETKPVAEAEKPVRPRMPVAADAEIGYDEDKLTEAREKYETAMDKYDADSRQYVQAQTAKELTEKAQKEKQEQEAAAIDNAHGKRVKAAEERHEDWAEVTEALDDAGFELHPAVYNGIKESDQGAEIIYHLATHLEEAEKLSSMRPDRALKEIGRLEAQFSDGGRKKPREKEPAVETKAAEDAEDKDEKPAKTAKTKEPETSSNEKPPAKTREPLATLGGGTTKATSQSALDVAEKQGSVAEYMRMRTAEREAKGLRP